MNCIRASTINVLAVVLLATTAATISGQPIASYHQQPEGFHRLQSPTGFAQHQALANVAAANGFNHVNHQLHPSINANLHPAEALSQHQALAHLAAVNGLNHINNHANPDALHPSHGIMVPGAPSVHHLHHVMSDVHQHQSIPMPNASPLFHQQHSSAHAMHQQQSPNVAPPQHSQLYRESHMEGVVPAPLPPSQSFRGGQLSLRQSLTNGHSGGGGACNSALLVRCHPSVQRVPCASDPIDSQIGSRYGGRR